ncbi:hypothetical protein CLG96_02495 [Sphingomonas oleivorans]|uniref:Porin n=1 Tax=Sphingomonas oleivorans TaxID=1735121 RepID=A0A2T5G1P3_9SPHN|nr:putative porin [Sphingomonas oleivorans]PTQ13030.1 hypothetical protein CLG96_02495 [Sphingomonas oleivorans]
MKLPALGLALATAFVQAPAFAADSTPPFDEAVETVIRLMVAEGVITPAKADAMRERYARERRTAAATTPAPATTSPSPAMPVTFAAADPVALPRQAGGGAAPPDPSLGRLAPAASRAADAAAARVPAARGALPDRVRIDGDFRIRWQGEYFAKHNSPNIPDFATIIANGGTTAPISNFLNATQDRTRLRYRARLGFTAAASPRVSAFFRLVVGNETEPTSTNETLGDYFNKDDVVVDRAYMRYRFNDALAFQGGRMANPFYSTDMFWDQDVNPEGVALVGEKRIGGGGTSIFGAAGIFALQDLLKSPDRWLYAGQLGIDTPLAGDLSLKIAGAYYHYRHISGRLGDEASRPGLVVKGNSLFDVQPAPGRIVPGLASRFHIGDVTGALSYAAIQGLAVTFTGEVARNFGHSASELGRLTLLTGDPTGDMAYSAEIRVGSARVVRNGDWQVALTWRRLESDSLLDAFTEGDFGLGGTNVQGGYLDLLYGVSDNTWLEALAYDTKSLGDQAQRVHMLRMALLTRF